MTQLPPWPKSLTTTIAKQVQRLRLAEGMSAQQLADMTAQLGYAIPRSVIANLESGRRDAVSVAELIVLARALRVPPLVLVFPLGETRSVALFPGTVVDTWTAAKWFAGDEPPPLPASDTSWLLNPDEVEEWPTTYFREQDRLLAEWSRVRRSLTDARAEIGDQGPDTPTTRPDILEIRLREAGFLERTLRAVEGQLGTYRALVRRQGVDLGELPPELAHVDRAPDGER